LKKGKTSTRQSKGEGRALEEEGQGKEQGIRVLVPLLSKMEAEPEFIEKVAKKAQEVVLLLVIDTNAMTGGFGFATSEIAAGNALMQKAKIALGKKRKTCNDVIEWGDTATKIEHFAQLHQVDKIYMVKQDNQFFQKLLKDMKEKLPGIEIEQVTVLEEA